MVSATRLTKQEYSEKDGKISWTLSVKRESAKKVVDKKKTFLLISNLILGPINKVFPKELSCFVTFNVL